MKKSALLLAFLPLFFFAQNSIRDSLERVLKANVQDTSRVNTLLLLCKKMSSANPDTAIILGNQAIALSQKLNWKKGEVNAEQRMGGIYWQTGDYPNALLHCNKALTICEQLISSEDGSLVRLGKLMKARSFGTMANVYSDQSDFLKSIEYYLNSFKIAEELKDKQVMGYVLGNISNVYFNLADYPKALDYSFKGLKIVEEKGDKMAMGRTIGNVANVYYAQGDYTKALEYYLSGLKICEEADDKQGMATAFENIGNVYFEKSDFSKALEYYFKSLKIKEAIGDKQGLGYALGNIANCYKNQGDFAKALEHGNEGLKIAQEIGDRQQEGRAFGNLGDVYAKSGNNKLAEEYLTKALFISVEIGSQDWEREYHLNLHNLFEKSGKPALALMHYKKYIVLRDTIFSQENSKTLMRSEINYEFDKKTQEMKHLQDKKDLQANEEKAKQKIITYSVTAGFVLVLLLAIFIFRGYREKQKANIIITQQKHEVEERKKEIIDSIQYAKRIQSAHMPSHKYIENTLSRLRKNKS